MRCFTLLLAVILFLVCAPLGLAGTTERVSLSTTGQQANGGSYTGEGAPVISADGRFVCFESGASNLVPEDTTGDLDVFVRDRETSTTELVSIGPAGEDVQGWDPAISADGGFAAFAWGHVYLRDRAAGATELISVSSGAVPGNGSSQLPAVSADGRFVAFVSDSSNLVPDDGNGALDVFVRDRVAGTTERVSVDSSEEEGDAGSSRTAISWDGRFVAFASLATNLVPDDTNALRDVFVRDRLAGTTERVSVSSLEEEGNGECFSEVSISADGRFVAFTSIASNLVPGDGNGRRDVFVRDREAGTTERVSVSTAGAQGNDHCLWNAISGDGRFVAFSSAATNLVIGDTNGCDDIFVRDRQTGTTECACIDVSGQPADGRSLVTSINLDGRFVAFYSDATDLVADDTNSLDDVFVRDRGYTLQLTGTGGHVVVDGTPETLPWTAAFDAGTDVTLEAVPDSGFVFTNWSGDLADTTNPIVITMDGNKSIIANFSAHTFTVTADPPDPATVVSGTETSLSATYEDSAGHGLASWSWSDGGAGGAFSPSADIHNPTYTAPDNFTAADIIVHLTVTATCDGPEPLADSDTVDLTVEPTGFFPDVPPDHWAYHEIMACFWASIVAGYPDGLYRPTRVVGRDQMAVYISRALCGGQDAVPEGPSEPTFPDVSADHWAYHSVEFTADNAIVQGYPDGSYQPSLDVTRSQMAVYIARSVVTPTGEAGLADYEPPASPRFPDVPTDYWSYPHIEYCAEHDIVQGCPDGYYRPAVWVTRDQMAVYIARAFELLP